MFFKSVWQLFSANFKLLNSLNWIRSRWTWSGKTGEWAWISLLVIVSQCGTMMAFGFRRSLKPPAVTRLNPAAFAAIRASYRSLAKRRPPLKCDEHSYKQIILFFKIQNFLIFVSSFLFTFEFVISAFAIRTRNALIEHRELVRTIIILLSE